MKLSTSQSVSALATLLECRFAGPADHLVTGINEIHVVEPGDLVFVDHPKYYEKALNSKATTILINKEVECPEGKALLISEDPFRDYNFLTKHFRPFQAMSGPVGENTTIAASAIIQPNVSIGNNVSIGENCLIHPGVTIYDHIVIEDDVVIHANTVIGSDAFYFQKREGAFTKMHSCGRVVVKKGAEIGSACTIDRGVSGDTIIGEGTKLDNQVHIGHDSTLGAHCLVAAQVGIAGCVTIGNDVKVWGQVGIKQDVVIHDGVEIYAQSGVGNDLEPNRSYFGSPAIDARAKWREMAAVRELPKIIEKLRFEE